MNGDRRYTVELTEDQALVLYRYLDELEDEQKLDPTAPVFDPAVHRALEIVYSALEDQLPRVDDSAAFERAHEELRREFRSTGSRVCLRHRRSDTRLGQCSGMTPEADLVA